MKELISNEKRNERSERGKGSDIRGEEGVNIMLRGEIW